jgi:hypothetical protein
MKPVWSNTGDCFLSLGIWRLFWLDLVNLPVCRYTTTHADSRYRGWLVPSIILLPQCLSFCELCSAMPLNGATYWWTAALAPPRLSRPLSFISGCTIVLSLFTGVASFAFAAGQSIIHSIPLLKPDFTVTQAAQMGVAMGVLALWATLMTIKLERISILFICCSKRLRHSPDAS